MLYLIVAIVCALISSAIGRPKGYPVWGFFLGLLLGVFGVIIIAFWKPKKSAVPAALPAAAESAEIRSMRESVEVSRLRNEQAKLDAEFYASDKS